MLLIQHLHFYHTARCFILLVTFKMNMYEMKNENELLVTKNKKSIIDDIQEE